MEGGAVRVRVDGNRGNAELAARADDPDGDLPSVGDQDLPDGSCSLGHLARLARASERGRCLDRVPAAFFRKTSGSISGPYADITKPAHVRFLDYEVEIGLVLGAEVPVGTTITTANIAGYVAGLVITNDVSARDLQLPKTQFFESKSYPTFTPAGPRLVLLSAAELARFTDLRLQTWVNGELRQDQTAADMITGPVMALNILTGFQALSPGDLLLTGTPGGTALKAPPKPAQILAGLLPAHLKWKAFFRRQAGNPNYLHHGDVVELRIATPDGAIDLGRQRTIVKEAS